MAQYELNLSDYLRIIHKRKFIIIFTFLASTCASWIYMSRQSRVYEAKTTIKIEGRRTIVGLPEELMTYNIVDVMQSAASEIKGFPVMKRVAIQLGMINSEDPVDKVNTVVPELQGSITTEPFKQTNIIEITATAEEPKFAMDLANTVAQAYIEENLLEKNKQARTVRVFIEEQLSSLEGRLRETEERLKTFGKEVKNIELGSPVQRKLVDLEVELASLLQKYTDKHPLVKQLKSQIQDLEDQLKGYSDQELEYARLNREVEVNRKLYAMLKERLEEARISEAQKVSDVSVVDPAVMPASPIGPGKRTGMILGGLLGIVLGFIFAFISENLDTSIGTIEDVEKITKLPVIGIVPSIKGESKEEPRFIKKYSFLFGFKKMKPTEIYTRLIVHHEPKSVMAEAFRGIRANLKLSPSFKTILITSAGPREGKTTVLTNLGLAIAQTGAKTLLVSSDLRRPLVAKSFGLREEPGLNEVLTKVIGLDEVICNISDMMLGEMKMEDIMKTPGMENIYILPSGHIPSSPAELLESKEINNLIEELKKRFDVIIFDSPPVLPIADAAVLASKVDGVILVYEAGRTARSALLRTKMQLESMGGRIAGVVLNHTRPGTEISSNYPYYYYNYKYKYEERKEDKKQKTLKEVEI